MKLIDLRKYWPASINVNKNDIYKHHFLGSGNLIWTNIIYHYLHASCEVWLKLIIVKLFRLRIALFSHRSFFSNKHRNIIILLTFYLSSWLFLRRFFLLQPLNMSILHLEWANINAYVVISSFVVISRCVLENGNSLS